MAAAVRALRAAEHVCVLTGAGISAESGIATFRSPGESEWANYSPGELATPEAFAANPALVLSWYAARRRGIQDAAPNEAHRALVMLASYTSHLTLVTQNVDDLHERAGSTGILALHGSIMRDRCSAGCSDGCGAPDARGTRGAVAPSAGVIRPCPSCGAPLRPDVVWFGEPLPRAVFDAACSAAIACDVFLSIGTSNVVAPAASLPWLAASHGATVIVINPTMEGQRSGPGILPLPGPAGDLLPQLVAGALAGRRMRDRAPDAGEPDRRERLSIN